MELDPYSTERMFGKVLPDAEIVIPGSTFYSPLEELGLPNLEDNQAIRFVCVLIDGILVI